MYSILAVDLDDTIVRADRTISERTMAAMAAWRASGRRVVIATGRPPRMTRAIPEALHPLPWICYNGAIVYEDQQVVSEELIHGDAVSSILDSVFGLDPDARVGLEIDDQLYLNRTVDRYDAIYVADLYTVAHRPAAKVLMSLRQYEAVADALGSLPDGVKALLSPKYDLAQLMPSASSKAAALQKLLTRWNVKSEEVVAFGDDINDVEMLQLAGLGVAVSNGVDAVKAAADRITASVEEDGVAQVIEDLLASVLPQIN